MMNWLQPILLAQLVPKPTKGLKNAKPDGFVLVRYALNAFLTKYLGLLETSDFLIQQKLTIGPDV
jgi:hypothetical protein